MRDPGTEPLPMISGDVVELTKLVYAERAAHAAEVARLRSVMTKARRLIAETFPPYSFPTPPEHEEEARAAHGVLVQIDAALAAPPTTAVEAGEAMRRALEEMRSAAGRQECFVCGHELSQHLDKYGCEAGVGDPDIGAPCGCKGASTSEDMRPEIEALARADAALAAWKEATRG